MDVSGFKSGSGTALPLLLFYSVGDLIFIYFKLIFFSTFLE
ncbi:MAG: hypothetical protein IGBAC_1234 [Ignavibacteriae bacterium]|nr:MAG: hypothetical protein IGBAC_1234 [Ignavibacteriota bacterium]